MSALELPAGRGVAGRALRALAWAAALAVAVTIPFRLEVSDQTLYSIMGLSVIVAVGLSLLLGFAGQISVGQGAFYAFGAYVAGILGVNYGWPTLLTVVVAPFGTALIALVVGVPLLRLRGHYLAFATLALHLILLTLLFTWEGFTGGQIGLLGIEPLTVAGREVGGAAYAAVIWVVALAVVFVSRNLVDSRAGRGLRAIAAGEGVAASLGVAVGSYKVRLFVLSAAFAGLAGGMYTYVLRYLSPDAFPILLSVSFLVMVAIGGMGSVYGAVVGAIAITLLQHNLQLLGTSTLIPEAYRLHAPRVISIGFFGLVLLVVMLFFPRGLLPALVAFLGRRRRRGARAEAPAALPPEAGLGGGDVAGSRAGESPATPRTAPPDDERPI